MIVLDPGGKPVFSHLPSTGGGGAAASVGFSYDIPLRYVRVSVTRMKRKGKSTLACNVLYIR